MRFTPTPLLGAYLIDLEKKEDHRGFFSRFFCQEEFSRLNLETQFIQANDSLTLQKGTLRGLHYQLEPMAEVKLVRCIRGALYDVIVDVRPASPTFGKHFGAHLTEENRTMMYVPKGFAHGFISLEDHTESFYLVSQNYSKVLERGIRWNDPFFSISWPITPQVISERDNNHPDFCL